MGRSAAWLAYKIGLAKRNPLFDEAWYVSCNPDIREAGIDPYRHFVARGAAEGRDPSPTFSTRWYLTQYPDVLSSGMDPLTHYWKAGAERGYDPHPLFDTRWYVEQNSDVRQHGINPLLHYVRHGWVEGRDPHPLFDVRWYLFQNADVAKAGIEPLRHYLTKGRFEGRDPHPLFDGQWYGPQGPDAPGSDLDPASQFWQFGLAEGRDPNALFDGKWYLERYPEVVEAGLTAFGHYLERGRREHRKPSADFDPDLYAAGNPDMGLSGLDPLSHYLRIGLPEGRSMRPSGLEDVTDCGIRCIKHPDTKAGDAVCLFIAHTPVGRVRPHVLPYLRALRTSGVEIVLILAADDPAADPDSSILDVVSGLYVRQNKGFDFAAWAHVLALEPRLYRARMLLFANDSVFGPFRVEAIKALVAQIEDSKADVIGLTDNYERGWHLQSYFLALKQQALSSPALHRFMMSVRNLETKDQVIQTYEVRLGPILRDSGLACEALFPSRELDNMTLFHWRALVQRGFPFLKVSVVRDVLAGVESAGWRECLETEGYDTAIVDRYLETWATERASAPGPVPVTSGRAAFAEPKRPLRVSFIGPWNYANGLGVASRGYVSALWHEPFEVNLHAIRRPFHTHARTTPVMDVTSFSGPPDLAIVHLNPDAWPGLLEPLHEGILSAARRRVGLWVWEMSHVPENWYPAFSAPDAIWAPSEYCAEVFRAAGAARVDVVPHVIEVDAARFAGLEPASVRADLGLSAAAKIVLYAFDGASYLARKNPMALLRAFEASGLASKGWFLILKTKNLFDNVEQGRALAEAVARRAGVQLINRSLDKQDMTALFWACDIYASSHCSEGFGLTIAEAMAAGKLVVATDFGGPRDFLDSSCGFPVRFTMATLGGDFGHYTRGGQWAEVDEIDLTRALCDAAAALESGRTDLGQRARERIRDRLGVAAVAKTMKNCAVTLLEANA